MIAGMIQERRTEGLAHYGGLEGADGKRRELLAQALGHYRVASAARGLVTHAEASGGAAGAIH